MLTDLLVEKLPRVTDERQSGLVLFRARRFTDKAQRRQRIALCKYNLLPRRAVRAGAAGLHLPK